MKVLLINPPTTGLYYRVGVSWPPLGLAYLAAVLREASHKVRIVDFTVGRSKDKWIDFEQWDLVGISADTCRYNEALKIAQEAKKKGVPTVMGGPHVTFFDNEALNTESVDYIVRGEGEYILLDLVQHLESGKNLEEVRGISYLRGGQFVINPNAPFIEDLDALPFPARDLLPLESYGSSLKRQPATSMITSRGCPYKCTFCSASQFSGVRWRARSPQSIIQEIEYIINNFRINGIAFMDDNFTLSPKRIIDICDQLIKKRMNLTLWCMSRVDTIVKNVEMVKRMAEAGVRMVFLGIESGSQSVLDSYKKKMTLDKAYQAVEILRKFKIRTWGSFILGNINETRAMIKQTIKVAKKLKPTVAQFSILTPYPGTVLYETSRNRIIEKNWSRYDGSHAVMRTDCLEPKKIQRLLATAYLRFYLRPSQFLKVFGYWIATFVKFLGRAVAATRKSRRYNRKIAQIAVESRTRKEITEISCINK